mgnify:CR=1 FL=1
MTPTFWKLTKAQRKRHYERSVKAGDTSRPSRTPGIWLVSSVTLSETYGRPVFYRVDLAHASCPCKGFATLGCCRHVARALHDAWHAEHPQPANVVNFPIAA